MIWNILTCELLQLLPHLVEISFISSHVFRKKEILGQFPSVNYKHLSLTLTYLSVVVFLQKLSQELRVRLLLERDLCFCLNKKVLLVSKKVVDVTLELPQRVTLQPLQPCRGCRLRRSTGPIPALLESMSHLPTKICKK